METKKAEIYFCIDLQQLVNLTRLRKLCLSDNEIGELPHNLGNLTNLAELDVSRNGKCNNAYLCRILFQIIEQIRMFILLFAIYKINFWRIFFVMNPIKLCPFKQTKWVWEFMDSSCYSYSFYFRYMPLEEENFSQWMLRVQSTRNEMKI